MRPPTTPSAETGLLCWQSRSMSCGLWRPSPVDENVDVARAAAAAMPEDSQFRGGVLATLGFCLLAQGMDPYDSGTLGEAIDAATEAAAVMAPNDPLRAAACYAISLAHQVRFDRCGDGSELEAAIVAGQEAVTMALRGDPQRRSYREHLSDLQLLKAERTGAISEIAEAVDMARRALGRRAGWCPWPRRQPEQPRLGLAAAIRTNRRYRRAGRVGYRPARSRGVSGRTAYRCCQPGRRAPLVLPIQRRTGSPI